MKDNLDTTVNVTSSSLFYPIQMSILPNTQKYLINEVINFGDDLFYHQLTPEQLKCCLNFSYKMAYEIEGHKPNRKTGSEIREADKIFADTLTGKIGEIAFFELCQKRDDIGVVSEVDFDAYKRGKWDNSDFIINYKGMDKIISIKTSKHYANLLLLEVANYSLVDNKDSQDLPKVLYNFNESSYDKIDYFIFCRFKIDYIAQEYSQNQIRISTDFFRAYKNKLRDVKYYDEIVREVRAIGEVVGFIRNRDLVEVIKKQHVIPRGAFMTKNEKAKGMKVDVDNYYIQSGCLLKFQNIKT